MGKCGDVKSHPGNKGEAEVGGLGDGGDRLAGDVQRRGCSGEDHGLGGVVGELPLDGEPIYRVGFF